MPGTIISFLVLKLVIFCYFDFLYSCLQIYLLYSLQYSCKDEGAFLSATFNKKSCNKTLILLQFTKYPENFYVFYIAVPLLICLS